MSDETEGPEAEFIDPVVMDPDLADQPWDGSDRRAWQELDAGTVAILSETNKAIMEVAKSMTSLADALTASVLKQGRGLRLGQWIQGIAIVVLIVFAIFGRIERADMAKVVDEVHGCVVSDGDCAKRQQATADAFLVALTERFKAANDENRKLLAQEIICYIGEGCPPGMDRDHLPDLEGLQK